MNHILQVHILSVVLFVTLLSVKVILLFSMDEDKLNKLRKKLIPLDIVLGMTLIGTGIYLISTIGISTYGGWMHLKLTLIVAAIPLSIIGFKKGNKKMVLIGLALFYYILILALTKSVFLM